MRRYLVPGNIALVVLAVVAVALAILAVQKQNAPSPASDFTADPGGAGSSAPPTQRPVAFVGDGYTSGVPDSGQGPANYTALLAGREDWRVTNPAAYGDGYVAGATLAAQLPQIVEARPQLVVVSAGRADDMSNPAAVRDAADRLYQDLRTRCPQATVVVIGPMWLGQEPPQRMVDVQGAIRDAAAEARLPFVDPIADRWFVDRDQEGIASNGVDLNDQGHRRLAELVDDALRRSISMPG